MKISLWRVLLTASLIAGCTPLPPVPADMQTRRFEGAAGKAVIYVVRAPMDSWEASTLALDDNEQITTYRGTYYRWEVAPGTHHVAGYAGVGGFVTLSTLPGKIYFVQHTVLASRRSGAPITRLQEVGDPDGRALVAQAQLLR
jgi:hypothetical protein